MIFRAFIPAALIVAHVFCLASCSGPKIYPITKSTEEVKRENEERIKASPLLQEIDRVCTTDIPLFNGLNLKSRVGWEEVANPFIAYTYACDTADNLKIRDHYKNFLTQNGWQLTKDQIGGVGPPWILESRKTGYAFSMTYFGPGAGGDIYTLTCTRMLTATTSE